MVHGKVPLMMLFSALCGCAGGCFAASSGPLVPALHLCSSGSQCTSSSGPPGPALLFMSVVLPRGAGEILPRGAANTLCSVGDEGDGQLDVEGPW